MKTKKKSQKSRRALESFKYKLLYLLKLREIKTFIQQMKARKESDITYSADRTLYQVFLDWICELTTYGAFMALIINTFFGWKGILFNMVLIPSCGLLRWLWLDLVKNTSNSIRGN